MKSITSTLSILGTLVFAAAGLSASPITTNVTLVNAGAPGLVDTNSGSSGDNSYVGPYTLSLDGTLYSAMCVDFLHQSHVGETWTAYETPVNASNLSTTYLGAAHVHNAGTIYAEEAYLYDLLVAPGANRVAIQEAAWMLTDTSFHTNNAAAESYLAQAQANYGTVNLSQFDVISSVGTNGYQQEFVIDPTNNPASATPEPASLGLIGFGLVGVGLAARKRIAKGK